MGETVMAYLTRSDNPLGADPGISIVDAGAGEVARANTVLDLVGGFDAARADEQLARLGWERAGDWQESGGQWAVVVSPWDGDADEVWGPEFPEQMSGICVTCGKPFVMVYELGGNGIWIDPDPVEGGELVLRGDPHNIPPGHFVAAFWNVGPEGDEYFGIPAGAPRYRLHDCLEGS